MSLSLREYGKRKDLCIKWDEEFRKECVDKILIYLCGHSMRILLAQAIVDETQQKDEVLPNQLRAKLSINQSIAQVLSSFASKALFHLRNNCDRFLDFSCSGDCSQPFS